MFSFYINVPIHVAKQGIDVIYVYNVRKTNKKEMKPIYTQAT